MRAVALALLMVPLSACLQLEGEVGSKDGCTVDVPAVMAGSIARYNVEGDVTFPQAGQVLVDWRETEAAGEQGPTDLPKGSEWEIRFEERLEQRMFPDGTWIPAWQVEHWAQRPQDDRMHHVYEEWLDEEGAMFASANPMATSFGSSLSFRLGLPAAFMASPLWGAPLENGSSFKLERWQSYIFSSIDRDFRQDLEYKVLSTKQSQEGCKARVEFLVGSLVQEGQADRFAVMVFRDGNALPTEVQGRAWNARLEELNPGAGPAWPASPPALPEWPVTTLEMRAPVHGAPAELKPQYPTGLSAGMRMAKEDPTVAAWLESHPDAGLRLIFHREGEPLQDPLTLLPGTIEIIDEWRFAFDDGTDALSVVVRYERSALTGSTEHTVSSSSVSSKVRPPTPGDAWPTLDALVAAGEAWYQEEVPVLQCNLGFFMCSIGTHEATGMPRASPGPEAWFSTNGLSFWTEEGIALVAMGGEWRW